MSTNATAFPPPPPLSRHPVDVGTRAEVAVISELVKRGYSVLVPMGVNHRYDFAVDLGDRIVRVQCKTGRLVRGSILFNTESVRANRNGWFRRDYAGEVEYLAVWCRETDTAYLVPVDHCATRGGALRVLPTRNGQARRIRWAKDYELPAVDALDSTATPA